MYPTISCHAGVSQLVRQLPVHPTIGVELCAEGEMEWNQTGDVENQVQFEPGQC